MYTSWRVLLCQNMVGERRMTLASRFWYTILDSFVYVTVQLSDRKGRFSLRPTHGFQFGCHRIRERIGPHRIGN